MQGWLPELISNLAEKRAELTKMKLAAVFDSYGDVRKVDDQLDTAIKNIEDAAEIRNRLSLWRDIEYFERRDMVQYPPLLFPLILHMTLISYHNHTSHTSTYNYRYMTKKLL